MADNAPTTTTQSNAGNSMLDFAIGMSILDALGGSGEVVGRRNSPFFNTTYDAFGFPRDRFSLIQNILPQQQGMGMWGGDLRDVLGGNAEVYGRSDSAFSFAMMNMLAGGGIFGLLMGLAAINAQAEHDRQLQAGATGPTTGTTTPAIGNASGTTATPGQNTPALATITVPGENDGQTPAIVPAGGASAGSLIRRGLEDPTWQPVMGIEQPDRLRREMEQSQATRTAGSTASSTEATISRQIVVPAGKEAPAAAVCEEPKEDVSISRNCTITRPKGPGGM